MEGEKKVKCPACGEHFELETDLEVGDTTYCPGCQADLEIVSLDPVRVEESKGSFGEDYEEDE